MKTAFISIFLVIILVTKCSVGFSQQDSSGIYFTADDYKKLKLSYAINCKTGKHKIKDDMIFHSKQISVKHAGVIHKHPKDSVYAIKYCDGSIVRIYKNSQYPMLNPGESIILYSVTSGAGTRDSPTVTKNYFSKDAGSVIQELTIHNLKSAFPENHKFHDLIDMEFHSNSDLISFDEIHKMMRVNRVLFISESK